MLHNTQRSAPAEPTCGPLLNVQVVLGLLVLLVSQHAQADWLHLALKVECSQADDTFAVRALAGYNELGERMIKDLGPSDVDPGTLITRAEEVTAVDGLENVRWLTREASRAVRECNLSDGLHEVRVRPRQCGDLIGISVEVRHGGGWSAPIHLLDDCYSDADLTIEVRIGAGDAEPELVKIPPGEYRRRTLADEMAN